MIQPSTESEIYLTEKFTAPWNVIAKQLVSERLVGMKNPYSMPWCQYKGNASQFYGPIAYSVLFGVPLQDSRVSGELLWQGNKLLSHLA